MRKRKAPLHKRVSHFLLPHKGNGYRPHVFRAAGVAALIVIALLLEGAYLGATKLVFPNTNFLASVLPTALVALTNGDRTAIGIGTVTEDSTLNAAAQLAANDMAAKGYFAHVSPDGKDPWYWLNQAGYSYQYAGQNLAVNFTDSTQVEEAWMNSPTHRANIVKPEYTKVGIGVANGMYKGKEATFVVQYFAAPAAAPASGYPEGHTAKAPAAPVAILEHTHEFAMASTVQPAVLGAETIAETPSAFALFFARLATSPTALVIYILSALALVVGILLIIAIVVKMRVQYLEVIGGGLLVLIVLIGLLWFDMRYATTIVIPDHAQSAAVSGRV